MSDKITRQQILEYLREAYTRDYEEPISDDEMASVLGLPPEQIRGNLNYLRQKNLIDSSEGSSTGGWYCTINANGLDELERIENESQKGVTQQDAKLSKMEAEIKDAKLEAERRKAVLESKEFGAQIEIITELRNELKRKNETTKEIQEIKSRLDKLENLSSTPQEQLVENVYVPCYNQMMNVYNSREFITIPPTNPWETISFYWKFKTEDEIKDLFERYTNELKKYHPMWMDFGNKFIEKRDSLGEILRPIFEKNGLLDQNGDVKTGLIKNPPKEWLHNCQEVIFNEDIRDEEELYRILKQDAERKWGKKYSHFLDEWHFAKPKIYTDILKEIPTLVKNLGTSYTYRELNAQRNILKTTIEELTMALKEKLK